MPIDLELLERSLDAFVPLVAGVDDRQWSAPTPCDEWDVRQLVNHFVLGQRIFSHVLRGMNAEAAQLAAHRDEDYLGDIPVESVSASNADLLVALAASEARQGTFRVPAGELPWAALVGLRMTESLVHGWDLAVATGQPLDFPKDVTSEALEFSRRILGSGTVRTSRFDDSKPVADDAPPLDKLVALLGRRPDWRPGDG